MLNMMNEKDIIKIVGSNEVFRKIIKKAFPEATGIRMIGDPSKYARFTLNNWDRIRGVFYSKRFHISVEVFSDLSDLAGVITVWRMFKGGHVVWGYEDDFCQIVKQKLKKAFKEVTGLPKEEMEEIKKG